MATLLLVSPLAKGAYYDAYLEVAEAEARTLFASAKPELVSHGDLRFLRLGLTESERAAAARMSFVQGIFSEAPDGALRPVALSPDFALPEGLVWGAKYRGKTHELVTQLALNLALHYHRGPNPPRTLLDPMAGRGTTLLWGLRYGLDARGVELDASARDALHAHLKKQAKLHHISHHAERGSLGGGRSRGKADAYIHFKLGQRSLRFVTGDAGEVPRLLRRQRFDLVVTDLPYGIDHNARGAARIQDEVARCAPAWFESLQAGGALVVIFNTYRPTRAQLERIAIDAGLEVIPYASPHRMSESIVRDLLVAVRPV